MKYNATKLFALSSKTYAATIEGHVKMSAKGVNQKRLLNDQPIQIYKDVLNTTIPHVVVNKGFFLPPPRSTLHIQTTQARSLILVC